MNTVHSHALDRVVAGTLSGGLPVFIFALSLILGAVALLFTAREEEPQIVVPTADVMVSAPGLSARQVERQVTIPLEKLLSQIPGVEHVYSRSNSGGAVVTLRFFVGEDREDALLNTYNQLYSNLDKVPASVSEWVVQPVEVDDVPIVVLGLWSENPALYGDFELRRFAGEISTALQGIEDAGKVSVTGGRPRAVRVRLKPQGMAAREVTVTDLVGALEAANQRRDAGPIVFNNQSIVVEGGDFFTSAEDLRSLVVRQTDGLPIYLRDVAEVEDGAAETENYSWINLAPTHPESEVFRGSYPLVTIAVAKKRGANAVWLADRVHRKMADLQSELLPAEVRVEILRDYGKTADEKVDNLTTSLVFAVATVVVFIGLFLGWRPAIVVGLAIPICYGATLALDMLFGYTINRVTLFALILSLGLLVDDPITGIDNIERFMRQGTGSLAQRIVDAMAEIRSALLMSTLTIILAFIPLAFITGMMGPYMAPMAFNVPVAVILSTVVAFTVTPWLASKALKPAQAQGDATEITGLYERLLGPLVDSRRKAWLLMMFVVVLFLGACLLPILRMVPLKLLPFDNKDEMQIVIDMPEGATLERTAAVATQAGIIAARLPEVLSIATYVGIPSPMDFNGMVRQYYRRTMPHTADMRLTLVEKANRQHQSHAVLLRLRKMLAPLNRDGVDIKVVEVPPGPPVISTLVAEIYGGALTDYEAQRGAAAILMRRLAEEPFVVDIDSSVEAEQKKWRFVTDKEKAALSGVTTEDIASTLAMANRGATAGFLNIPREAEPLPIVVRLPPAVRGGMIDLGLLQVKGRAAQRPVFLAELGHFVEYEADKAIFHKDLRPVVYVMADLEGRTPAEVIADINADFHGVDETRSEWDARTFLSPGGGVPWSIQSDLVVDWGGEGEWQITVRVFRDMGLAFLFALVAIFFVLRAQTGSTALSLIIMSAIPLTVIGIMPGFWVLNQFGERLVAGSPDPVLFTATAMIGMIALAGIVVRNSLILVEFITQARRAGMALREALLQAGAIRMRPVLLTAGTTLLGNLVITLDPVFSGLAIAIIFGILASTLFTLLVVPVVYYLVYASSDHSAPAMNHEQSI